jgi:ankyrin repeat protein
MKKVISKNQYLADLQIGLSWERAFYLGTTLGNISFLKMVLSEYFNLNSNTNKKILKTALKRILNKAYDNEFIPLTNIIKAENVNIKTKLDIVFLLLKHGALLTSDQNISLFRIIIQNNLNPLSFKQLNSAEYIFTVLQLALEYKKIDLAELLVKDIDKSVIDYQDQFLIFFQALLGNKKTAEFVFKYDLLPNMFQNALFNKCFVSFHKVFFSFVNLEAFKVASKKLDNFLFYLNNALKYLTEHCNPLQINNENNTLLELLDERTQYYSILEKFCYYGNLPLVKYLIEELGYNINETKAPSFSPLANCIISPYRILETTETAKYLITAGANINLKSGPTSAAPITFLLISNKKSLYEFLIEKNVDIEARDNLCNTPLLTALVSINTHTKSDGFILKDFIENHNPNLNAKNVLEETIFHAISTNLNIPLEDNVIQNLMLNAIKTGIDINAKDCISRTALNIAIEYNNERIFFMLVNAGADINLETGKESLHPIYFVRNKNIFDFYLTKLNLSPKKLEDIFYHFFSLPHLQENSDYKALFDYFDSKNLKINHRFKDGNTPLLLSAKAIYSNNKIPMNLLDLLILKGVDINAQDQDGNSAVMLLAKHGKLDLLLEFLEKYQQIIDLALTNKENLNIIHNILLNESISKNNKEICILNNYPSILRKLFDMLNPSFYPAILSPAFKKNYITNIQKIESIIDLHNYLN